MSTQNPNIQKESAERPMQSNTLQSWKEIAAYLKRGVRTAQRWERNAGLPVRRPRSADRSPVFAFPEELDAWMLSSRGRGSSVRDPMKAA